jgi:hypothetical protein
VFQLSRLIRCCCKKKRFLLGINKLLGPIMAMAEREEASAIEVRPLLSVRLETRGHTTRFYETIL